MLTNKRLLKRFHLSKEEKRKEDEKKRKEQEKQAKEDETRRQATWTEDARINALLDEIEDV